jgi:hypothetical protein
MRTPARNAPTLSVHPPSVPRTPAPGRQSILGHTSFSTVAPAGPPAPCPADRSAPHRRPAVPEHRHPQPLKAPARHLATAATEPRAAGPSRRHDPAPRAPIRRPRDRSPPQPARQPLGSQTRLPSLRTLSRSSVQCRRSFFDSARASQRLPTSTLRGADTTSTPGG